MPRWPSPPLLALTACAALCLAAARPARADSPRRPPPAGSAQTASVVATKPARAPPPLSAEDAALVRELALVENADLLEHLELFDSRGDAPARPEPAQPAH